MATTTNLGLTLPTVGADDDTWGTVNNAVINGFDAVFGATGAGTAVGLNVGAGKTLALGGAMSQAAWTTAGVKIKLAAATYTDTSTGAGTQAASYINVLGAPTFAFSNAVTVTNAFNAYFADPVAGTNATLTSKWAIGADSASFGSTTPVTVSSAGIMLQAGKPAFLAIASSTASNVTGDGTVATIAFGTEIFDRAGNFASNTFTAPVTGLYRLSAAAHILDIAAGHTEGHLRIVTSNRTFRLGYINPSAAKIAANELGFGGSVLVDMDVGDTATVAIVVGGSTKTIDIFGDATTLYTFFSGELVA